MKKSLLILLGCLMALGLVCNWAWGYFMGYERTVDANWGIDLPHGCTEVYGYSEPSFHGDGIRYHVLDYPFGRDYGDWTERIWKVQQLFYEKDKATQSQLDTMAGLLREIQVEPRPDFSNYPLHTQTQGDGSRLYMMLDSTTGRVYILEDFL